TPYRIDLFNALAQHFELRTLFFRANPVSQSFDQARLRQQLQCSHGDLTRGVDILGRQFRWGVGSAIRAFQPRVVVAMEYAPSTWMAAWEQWVRRNQWGLVLWTADNVAMCRNASWLRAMARKGLLQRADGLVVYTADTRDWYAGYGFNPERIAICANINRPENFRARLTEAMPLAQSYFQHHDLAGKQVFLSVGRLSAIKGVDRILHAFGTVHGRHPETRLAIVGDGTEKGRLQSLARELNVESAVIFTGQMQSKELSAWYLLGQVFILASEFEPYGAVVHEALTAGMPVLCTQIAGARDLIVEGKNGWLFDPWEPDALRQRMLAIMQNQPPHRCAPITLSPSLMPVSFEDGVLEFVRIVKQADR
ncbi:MAG TPA: glycosyltransferase, partial [Magnetococcales bacterium]|nr:glycosyltransferase [Magnetococcales bacterium]